MQSLPEGVELALQDVDYTHSESGIARWRFKADHAERTVSEGQLAVENLMLTFYDEKGAQQMVMRADEGVADQKFTEFHASGNVIVESERGYHLTADRLVYKQADHKIYSDSPVVLTTADLTVDGHGLVIDLNNQTISVYGGVKAVLPGPAPVEANQ